METRGVPPDDGEGRATERATRAGFSSFLWSMCTSWSASRSEAATAKRRTQKLVFSRDYRENEKGVHA
jgi:hypothetical protein